MKNAILLLFLLITSFTGFTQSNYEQTDKFVKNLGSLDSLNVAQIAKRLSAASADNEQQARAIFYWIANNIAIDPKTTKSGDQRKSLPEDVVKLRKATPLGFAKLFQEMASQANIRCLVVDGYVKNSIDDLGNPADEINHSWNVVQLGQSPEAWFVVDATKASGWLDKKMSAFTKNFTPEYFFADKTLFNLDHYPDNAAWQLGGGPKSLKDFYALPIISSQAYKLAVKKLTPATGFVKTKTKNKVSFSIPMTSDVNIENVSLLIGDAKKMPKPEPMNFTSVGGALIFSYQFKMEDTYPVKILVNNEVLAEYMVEVSE
jgi:transglutaminase/protease-like cytokinesis protein 3